MVIMHELFHRVAAKTSKVMGAPFTFLGAVGIVIIWAFSRPLFNSSDTWQLVINTGTTIMTFLMVFLIQNTQNRDSKAVHLKLDELLSSSSRARNEMIDLEDLTDQELEALDRDFRTLREQQEISNATQLIHHKVNRVYSRRKAK
jgi:low affinity Fe/Cu permease